MALSEGFFERFEARLESERKVVAFPTPPPRTRRGSRLARARARPCSLQPASSPSVRTGCGARTWRVAAIGGPS